MIKRVFLFSLIISHFLVFSTLAQVKEGTITGRISEINIILVRDTSGDVAKVTYPSGVILKIKNKNFLIQYQDAEKYGLKHLINEYENSGQFNQEKYKGRMVTIKYDTEIDSLWKHYLVTSLKWHE